MQIDKITFNDISLFHNEEEFSIFHKLNFTRTAGGKEWLRRFFYEPHSNLNRIYTKYFLWKPLQVYLYLQLPGQQSSPPLYIHAPG